MVVMGKSSSDVAKNLEPVKVTVQGISSKPVAVKGACIGPVVIRPVMQLPIISEKTMPWSYSQVMVMHKGKEVVEEICEAHGLTRWKVFCSRRVKKGQSSSDKEPSYRGRGGRTFKENEGARLLHCGAVEEDPGTDLIVIIVDPFRRAPPGIDENSE